MHKEVQRRGRRRARSQLVPPSLLVIWIIGLEGWWTHQCTMLTWHRLKLTIMALVTVLDLPNQKSLLVARSLAIMKTIFILVRRWLLKMQETLSKHMYLSNKQWVQTQDKMIPMPSKDLWGRANLLLIVVTAAKQHKHHQ